MAVKALLVVLSGLKYVLFIMLNYRVFVIGNVDCLIQKSSRSAPTVDRPDNSDLVSLSPLSAWNAKKKAWSIVVLIWFVSDLLFVNLLFMVYVHVYIQHCSAFSRSK